MQLAIWNADDTWTWMMYWANFISYVNSESGAWQFPTQEWTDHRDRVLGEYNATIVRNEYLEFATEEDMTLFLLRWS